MSDIFTLVTLPGSKYDGQLIRGTCASVKDAIDMAREIALHNREEAEACMNALDRDFRVEVVRGAILNRVVKVLQEEKPHG